MPKTEIDRETAKGLRREFREDVTDELARFVEVQEAQHGDSLKYWLSVDSVEEVWKDFLIYLQAHKGKGTRRDPD